MPEEIKAAETITKPKAAKPVKVGDAVHLVAFREVSVRRFNRFHLPAKVTKVHGQGKLVDLVVAEDSDKPTEITASPRDDSGTQPDSWHLPEEGAGPN